LIKGQIENRALPRALRHAIERHRTQMETELIRTEQLRLKDEFLSHVSHELRSPLTSIYSFGTIIADGLAGATNPQQDEYLQIILRNVRQLQSMIEDLLTVTQVHEGKLSVELARVSVSDAITYAVDTLNGAAQTKEITLFISASGPLPPAYADLTRLRQILTILVDNAVKFTPSGGAVTVQSVIFEEDPRFLLVQVSDTGCGIGPEMAERVFEHLYQIDDPGQAGRKGLGLGLYIAKELVTRQGGKIWVNSTPKRGSHFCFTVPIYSIGRLIGPMVNHEQKPGEAITMLAVEICSRGDSADVQRETLETARKLLQRCLRPDIDVLLRVTAAAKDREHLFVVGYSLEQGAEVISSRIRTRFQDCPQLLPPDFTFVISPCFLAPLSREINESTETFAERQAAGIEECIRITCQ
jgi:nitrogen-specific signal transduction histidine kinase